MNGNPDSVVYTKLTASIDFEPILEDLNQPRDTELFLYEEYARQQLPRRVQDAVESIVEAGTQPLKEQLLAQLTTIIHECQSRIFSDYMSQKPVSRPSAAAIDEATTHDTIIGAPGLDGTTPNELAPFFQMPPPPPMDVVGFPTSTTSSSSHGYNSSASLGYQGDISTVPSSQNSHACSSDDNSMASSRTSVLETGAHLPVFTSTHSHHTDNARFPDGGEDLLLNSADSLLEMSQFEDEFGSFLDCEEGGNTKKGFDGVIYDYS